ncbi:hypothetical protein WKH50_19165 [Pantoea agglomerans]|uniref:hypothetical protein n=1 Tax=Enterobacter agglomerans TaxID=549 RepID=UPI0007E55C82|nr:hypothetical protein [Pantoea agglomerans]WHU86702.1 hypothetical protein A7P62_12450 [Pantoea agglomerans pv. gypsophilae]
MVSKVWKIVKEVTIGTTLLLTLSLVISGALKNAGIIEHPGFFIAIGIFLKSVEYGNLSDWISSLSTFFTLLIALIAYSKWQETKYRDDSYQLQKDIITKNYYSLYKTIDDVNVKIGEIKFKCLDLHHSLKKSVIENMQENLIDLMSKLELTSQEIKRNIEILSIFNCHLNETFENVNHNILQYVEITNTTIRIITNSLEGIQMDQHEFMRKKSLDFLAAGIKACERNAKVLKEGRSYLYNSDVKLHEFFVFKPNK